jgi:TolB-like protein/class 3 adenylate cyclase/thioredoxin-like negative regulator of GroEL
MQIRATVRFAEEIAIAPEAIKRKLTTILAADVEGYSRLMSADEEATLQTLKNYREIIDGLIAKHDGRIFSTAGDSVIAEFGSTVEAVRCAITIQEELRIENAELAAEAQMKFRIGVNVGDVMVEDDNLYGDGVNIAARLEGEAEAGGICISGSAFDQVKDKLSISFEDIGPQEVKNITQPVPAFRVVPGPVSVAAPTATSTAARRWRVPAIAAAVVIIIAAGSLAAWQPWITKVEAANPDNLAFPLPDKPSIAVLPFENLSGDAKQDFLGDGITENITTALSRVADMFVIPRTTTRAYKGKAVRVAQVAEELGVRYVLEGSVQQSGDQVRVTATLIDALKGHQIWTERYDREVKDAFALQDDIALNVLTELAVKLTLGEQARTQRGGTKNLEAYQLFRRGIGIQQRLTKESVPEARRLIQQAVELDPNYALPWNMLGWIHLISASRGWSEDPAQDRARALELAHKALALDPSGGAPYILLANISAKGRRYDEAIGYIEKAVALHPNNPFVAAHLGRMLALAGRPEEALAPIQRVKRFSPIPSANLLRWEGVIYYTMGRYEEAVTALEAARARNPKGVAPVALLAMTYADMGRVEEARATAQAVLDLSPSFSAKGFANAMMPFKDRTKTERALATLLEAGLPE